MDLYIQHWVPLNVITEKGEVEWSVWPNSQITILVGGSLIVIIHDHIKHLSLYLNKAKSYFECLIMIHILIFIKSFKETYYVEGLPILNVI